MATLMSRLRAKDKKGLFTRTQTAVGYSTGFAPFDYRNGYMVQVRDMEDNLVTEYPSTGAVGGSFITIVGKSGVAKTTFAIQMASNIVKRFESGMVQHYDLEQALTYTRIKNVNGFSQYDLMEKYNLKQEKSTIEDIYDSIEAIAKEKEENREDYMYDTGLLNEFNQKILSYVPTVVILDSIPTMSSKDTNPGMEGGTYANRVAKALAQFYKRLTPIIKAYNIIVIAINHINYKMEINPFAKTQAQLNYMKQDESMPGGNAPIYYAHTLVKFVYNGKLEESENGFDGFAVRCEFLKSRTNKAGQFCRLIYNQELGFDPILTQYQFAEDNGLVEGRNPKRYFTGHEEARFDNRKFRKQFLEDEKIRFALFDTTVPFLERTLSRVDPNETVKALTEMEIIERLGVRIIGEHDEEL